MSVIIPCHNHAGFLPQAIDSVKRQTHPAVEIIVVDDGSEDHTEEVVRSYADVRYVKQQNRGVTAARNAGLLVSNGAYVTFLDADDRLLPQALQIGMLSLAKSPGCALTFGTFFMIDTEGKRRTSCHPLPLPTYGYRDLLERNFIGNPGVVLYCRWALSAVNGFDPSNGPAGDYDLYLRIARSFPIACHRQPVVEYRRHGSNMSNDPGIMLKACLSALKKQRSHVKGDPILQLALHRGMAHWKEYYGEPLICKLYEDLAAHSWRAAIRGLFRLIVHYPGRLRVMLSRKILLVRKTRSP